MGSIDRSHLTADALCDFAEGLMPPADRREAEAHLAGCAECRREAAAMQGYFRVMSALGTLKAPERFLTKVHARIAQASPWRRLVAALSSTRLLPAPLMGLAVVLIGVYFVFLSPRVAEQALSEVPAGQQAPEPIVKLAEKPRQPAVADEAATQAGAAGNAAVEPPTQVAPAPAKPPAPQAEAPKAERRIASPSKAKADRPAAREAAGKAAPARPKTADSYAESAPAGPQAGIASARPEKVEIDALAMAEPPAKAQGRGEKKAEAKGGGAATGDKAHNLKATEVVGWLDNPSAVYILDGGQHAGDPVADQIAGSPGTADRLMDAPTPAPKPSAAKAETVAVEKPVASVAAAKAESSPAEALESAPKVAAQASKPAAIARSTSREDLKQSEAKEESEYLDGAMSRKRSAPVAAAPPAVTPKPWAPQVYTLKARIEEAALRSGLAKLGIKILRQEEALGRRYELEVPSTKVADLETWLAARGSLTTTSEPSADKQAGAPIHLTLKIVAP